MIPHSLRVQQLNKSQMGPISVLLTLAVRWLALPLRLFAGLVRMPNEEAASLTKTESKLESLRISTTLSMAAYARGARSKARPLMICSPNQHSASGFRTVNPHGHKPEDLVADSRKIARFRQLPSPKRTP